MAYILNYFINDLLRSGQGCLREIMVIIPLYYLLIIKN